MLYKKGSRGEAVKEIQEALHLYPDGIFGKITDEAVREFQKEKGLTVDGIVGEKTWAALMEGKDTFAKSTRKINEIIIHCTATAEGKDFTVGQIRRWHTTPVAQGGRGFSDIGYHYVVYRDGSVHTGRNINVIGAHCKGHNSHSIGIVYVGGCAADGKTAKDTRTNAQKAALEITLRKLRTHYPSAKIIGHRDTSPDLDGDGLVEPNEWIKLCPSFDATAEYKKI